VSGAAQKSNAPVVAVLGMHRSGTSWLAGSLQGRGLELGDVSLKNANNRRGNREHPTLLALHEGVLEDGGGSWRAPPAVAGWAPARLATLRSFVIEMNARFGRWGFKDPRTLLFLDTWRREVPQGLQPVGIFRHPGAVHQSLAARHPSLTPAGSARMWTLYNRRLLEEWRRAPFPLLRFDVSDDDRASALNDVCRTLALASYGADFFAADLMHHEGRHDVPEVCAEVWAGLLAARAA